MKNSGSYDHEEAHVDGAGRDVTDLYPWPPEWRGNTQKLGNTVVGMIAVSVVLVVLGRLSLPFVSGWMLLSLGAAAAVGALLLHRSSISNRRCTINGVTTADGRLRIRYDRWGMLLAQIGTAAVLCASVFGLLLAYFALTSGYAGDLGAYAGFALALSGVVWTSVKLLSRVLCRRDGQQLGLALSPHGVHHTSWWGESRYRWSYVDDISVHSGTRPTLFSKRKKSANHLLVTLVLTPNAESLIKGDPLAPIRHWHSVMKQLTTVNASTLDVYPPVVPLVITFYFEHPELRWELETERALERVRSGDFTT